MAEVNFYLKEPNSKEETLIYLFFSYNGKRLKYSTSEKINPSFWNTSNQRIRETKKFPEYPEFNARLDSIQADVKNIYRKLLNDKIEPTNEKIKHELNKSLLKTSEPKKLTLFTFIEKYIEECKAIKQPKTIAAYRTTYSILREYYQLHCKYLNFEDITLEFYNSFLAFLTQKEYTQNTIGKHIKVLKTFMNEATERGLNINLDYRKKGFRKPTEDVDKVYLNTEELKSIYELDLTNNNKLDKTRDLFIVGCYTGLRFSDYSEIKKENILDKNKIKITTSKTGELVVIPLHKYVREILEKYQYELPNVLSNQKMNEYIKELVKKAGITQKIEQAITKGGKLTKTITEKYKLISTHTARRSFATNLYLADVPAITIMKITGHRTEKSFLRYIRISQEENANKLLNHSFFK